MQATSSMRSKMDEDDSDDGLPVFGNPNELRTPKAHYFPSKPRTERMGHPARMSHLMNGSSHVFTGTSSATLSNKGKEKEISLAEAAASFEDAPERARRSESVEEAAAEEHEDDDGRSEDGQESHSRNSTEDARSTINESSRKDESGSAKKRSRTLTTAHQTAVLNALLAKTRFPSTETREEVGAQIGMSARRVQIWFQNRRQSQKRQREREAADHAASVAAAANAHHQAQSQYAQMTPRHPVYAARPVPYDPRPMLSARLSYESQHPSLQERRPQSGYASRPPSELYDTGGRPLSLASQSSYASATGSLRPMPMSASVSSSGGATARPMSAQSNTSRLSDFSRLHIDSPGLQPRAPFFAGPMSPSAERMDELDYLMATVSRPTRVAPARSLLPGPPVLPFPSPHAAAVRHSEADAALQAPILPMPNFSSNTFPTRQATRLPPLREVFPRASTYSASTAGITTATNTTSTTDRKPSLGSDWSHAASSSARTSMSDGPVHAPIAASAPIAPIKQPISIAPARSHPSAGQGAQAVPPVPAIPPISALTSAMDLDQDTAAEWREASSRLRTANSATTVPYSHIRDDDPMDTD